MDFDDLMKTYSLNDDLSNRKVYGALLNQMMNNRVTPIIGAGLSRWAKYPLWEQLLWEKAINTPVQSNVKILLAEHRYEQAASVLEKFYNPFSFINALKETFSPDKINESDRPSFQRKIPALFQGPIVTTNFDVSLERLLQCPFVVTPENEFLCDEIEARIQKNAPLLIKLHGDVQDANHMILTNERYSEMYGSDEDNPDTNRPIPKTLRKIFSAAPPFFIGCGLNGDRTGAVMKACKGASGFAILELPASTENPHNPINPNLVDDANQCFVSEFAQRLQYLDDMKLQVIWYPHGMHESVGILIDQLYSDLTSTSPRKGTRSKGVQSGDFQKLVRRIKNPSSKKDPLSYDSNDIFVSRENEMNEITEFLNRRKKLLFMVICGPGGVGKSKLVYSFFHNNKKWDYRFIDSASVNQFEKMHEWSCDTNTCLVYDDADLNSEPLLKWFEKLFSQEYQGDKKLRVILLARGETGDDTPDRGVDWFEKFINCSIPIEDYWHQKRFLFLSDFDRKETMRLANDYIFTRKKRVMSDAERMLCNSIFFAENEDAKIFRPLFVLVIVEQFVLKSYESIGEYNVADIYEHIYENNCKKWSAKIGDSSLFGALKRIYAYATITGAWNCRTTDLPLFLENEEDILREKSNCSPNNNEYARWFSILSDGRNKGNVLKKLKPDLLGEYYVLRVLNELTQSKLKKWMKSLMRDTQTISFFRRVISDFGRGLSSDEIELESRSHLQSECPEIVLSTRHFIQHLLLLLLELMQDEVENKAVAELINHYFNLFPIEMSEGIRQKLRETVLESTPYYCWVEVYIDHFLAIHDNQTIDHLEKRYLEVMTLCNQWDLFEATELARVSIIMLGQLLGNSIAELSADNVKLSSVKIAQYWNEYTMVCTKADNSNMVIKNAIIISDSRILEPLTLLNKKNQDLTPISSLLDSILMRLENRLSSQIDFFLQGSSVMNASENVDKDVSEALYNDVLICLIERVGKLLASQLRNGIYNQSDFSNTIEGLIRCIKKSSNERVVWIAVPSLFSVAYCMGSKNMDSSLVNTIFAYLGSVWRAFDKKQGKKGCAGMISHIESVIGRFFSSTVIGDEIKGKAIDAFEAK